MPGNGHHDVNASDKSKQFLKYATEYHAPVLCNDVIEGLITDSDGIYLDATFGGGGHAAALMDALGAESLVIGVDQDLEAIEQGRSRLGAEIETGKLILVSGNFARLEEIVAEYAPGKIDGVLFDLGVSSHQLDVAKRGFSHRSEGPLDMRMNTDSALRADAIVNTWTFSELVRLFRINGEEPRAPAIARRIVNVRPISTTRELAEVVRKSVPELRESKTLARIFQAIRIGVNEELDMLEQGLHAAANVLKPKGRLVAISYHSLEDRRVKRFLRTGNFEGRLERDIYGNPIRPFRELTRKPVSASEEETGVNSRARSARLRIGEKTSAKESGVAQSGAVH